MFAVITSFTPNNIDAILTGKYNMNVYLIAVLLSSPLNRDATNTNPLLDIPGTTDTA